MSFQFTLLNEWLITHIADYGRFDVPSDGCADWMIYCTRHSEMAAYHYVCFDVPSDGRADGMIYYRLHS
jgi:hypothetical protein